MSAITVLFYQVTQDPPLADGTIPPPVLTPICAGCGGNFSGYQWGEDTIFGPGGGAIDNSGPQSEFMAVFSQPVASVSLTVDGAVVGNSNPPVVQTYDASGVMNGGCSSPSWFIGGPLSPCSSVVAVQGYDVRLADTITAPGITYVMAGMATGVDSLSFAAVPEPGTLLIALFAVVFAGWLRRHD